MIFSDMSFQLPVDQPMFQPYHHDPNSIISPQDYQGGVMGRSMSFSRCEELVRGEDEMSDDDGVGVGEKKRRLNLEQVKALEKSFELGNKLEPERKMQLARALGLQPRQIAIWFQNRRARWKTKQLERDYDLLKTQFDALKSDNDSLKSHNKKLHHQLLALKGRESGSDENRTINLNKETHEGSWSNGSENSCDHLNTTTAAAGLTQVFRQTPSSTPNLLHSQHRINQGVPDETFCNMFNGIDDHPSFWPWPDQHHNFHG